MGGIRRGVVQGDVVTFAELLELLAGELSSVVQDDALRGPVVRHVLGHVFNDVCCVFGFKGEKTLHIYYNDLQQ